MDKEGQQKSTDINSTHVCFLLVERTFSLLQLVVKFGFPSWAAIHIAEALAGKNTNANIIINVLKGNTSISISLFAIVALGVWAFSERSLRKRKTKELQNRIIKLEKRIDPDRTTSDLTEMGDNNPEDLRL